MCPNPENRPRLFSIDPATKAALERITQRKHCSCLANRGKKGTPSVPNLHAEAQDIRTQGWAQTVELIRANAIGCSTVFEPSAHVPWDDWMKVITLSPEIADLTNVGHVRLYGSHLRRLPPEIGRMTALENLDIYTSYSLHWLPYEVTRCPNLRESRMSTRALYGNKNTRLPFPRLSRPVDVLLPKTCSVCDRPFGEAAPQLYWTTQYIGTDHTPLLIHSCSRECTLSVPAAPKGYFERPHKGGGGVGMPVA
jgi:hypothetical protein